MCLKCALKWAFVPPEGLTQEECTGAYFVLQSPIMGSYNKDRDVFINRFWRKEEALQYFYKMQYFIIYKSQT